MNLESLEHLYISELQDLYNAEKQLIKALPKMAKGASSADLSDALNEHLAETREHATRLEQILRDLGEKPGGETCEAMQGLITEGEEVLKAKGADDSVRDAAIIVSGNKVEHYEIAGYGSAIAFAKLLGRRQDIPLLKTTLEEEKAADKTLTQLAETVVNVEAAG